MGVWCLVSGVWNINGIKFTEFLIRPLHFVGIKNNSYIVNRKSKIFNQLYFLNNLRDCWTDKRVFISDIQNGVHMLSIRMWVFTACFWSGFIYAAGIVRQ